MTLTELAHTLVATYVSPGDAAIDATAGNGWDTAFLVQRVGPQGRVFAFDVQPAALDRTRQRVSALAGCENVQLICASHALLATHIPREYRGQVKAVMFNLGYLPRGDHARVTAAFSTVAALEAARAWLHPEGVISVLAYRGHAGGNEEAAAVEAWIANSGMLADRRSDAANATGPVLWLLRHAPFAGPLAKGL